jgi:peptidoglycan/xylan/chitin deacetylase (PgdA/CDA1 family)/ketosteroid isomerase-like protein
MLALVLSASSTVASLLAASPTAVSAARPLLVTVDDLPISHQRHPEPAERQRISAELLLALARHHVPAVGFVIWGRVEDESDRAQLESWLAAGHELGNHSDQHPNLSATAADAWLADVEQARAGLEAFLAGRGRSLRFFRFPFLREGDTDAKLDAVRAWLARTGQRNLTVTIDDQDWSFEEPWITARRAGDVAAQATVRADYLASLRLMVRHHERNGDRLLGRATPQVLLLHANEVGAANWNELFSWLEQAGHRFATADEVLADAAFADLPRVVAPNGFSLWDRLAVVRRESDVRERVARLLDAQAAAWTRGDLEAFCAAYAEDAAFVTQDGLTRGRQAVLDRYRQRYPDGRAMGKLTFELLELRPAWGVEVSLLGDAAPSRIHSTSLIARWTLKREGRPDASGLTMLVLRPRGDDWEIVEDASL